MLTLYMPDLINGKCIDCDGVVADDECECPQWQVSVDCQFCSGGCDERLSYFCESCDHSLCLRCREIHKRNIKNDRCGSCHYR